MTEDQIIAKALEILASRVCNGESINNNEIAAKYLQVLLADRKAEVFVVMFLSTKHCLIECREMFHGTIDSAAVYPREVVRAAIDTNAAAVILAHNHPSGSLEPSRADVDLTQMLAKALQLIDVRILDHIIVSNAGHTSFADRGLL